MFVLKHGSRQESQYLRHAAFGYTGLDLSYCDEKTKAMQFASRSAAIHVGRCLVRYGNFYAEEV